MDVPTEWVIKTTIAYVGEEAIMWEKSSRMSEIVHKLLKNIIIFLNVNSILLEKTVHHLWWQFC